MKNKTNLLVIAITAIFALFICTSGFVILLNESPTSEVEIPIIDKFTTETTTTEPTKPYVTSKATIGSAGDVLIHKPIFESALKSDGTYDFTHLFTYSKSVISSCDYFVANLETTLGGTDGRTYQGFPCFNSPDSVVTALKGAGVDCLLTANNHTYDTKAHGVQRTLSVIKSEGLDHIGTRTSPEESRYFVKSVNDISFGFTCYTYETEGANTDLNGLRVDSETAKLINTFDYDYIDIFYTKLSDDISAMKQKGAEVIVVYIHWGEEYQLSANSHQKAIAQKLCDMGVDVIVGGHPHVVQPTEILTSTDGKQKTYCLYSLGNIMSNQRRSYMGLKTGHTEDGLIFTMSFSKYSDGKVIFDYVELIPTWVHYYSEGGKKIHTVVPLNGDFEASAEALSLKKSSDGLSLAKGSYERTTALVGETKVKMGVVVAK